MIYNAAHYMKIHRDFRKIDMMTSSNETIFRVTGPLCGEFTGHQWNPLTKASDAALWFFFICAWTICWVNDRNAGDLKRHYAHYDVTIMNFLVMDHCSWLINLSCQVVIISSCLTEIHGTFWRNMIDANQMYMFNAFELEMEVRYRWGHSSHSYVCSLFFISPMSYIAGNLEKCVSPNNRHEQSSVGPATIRARLHAATQNRNLY